MRKLSTIYVHCSATPVDRDIGVKEIRNWHVNDRGWSDIGYHFVIRRDGTIEVGRPLHRSGAHVKGHNHYSVGICLVGPGEPLSDFLSHFTMEQSVSLSILIGDLEAVHGSLYVRGHNDVEGVTKTCPGFRVEEWL